MKDIVEGVPHFMVHPNTGRGDSRIETRSSRGKPPVAVERIQEKINNASVGAAGRSVTRISAEDLFYGTCIRYDRASVGRLTQADLRRVFREIKCNLGEVEMKHLVGWYDVGGADEVTYKDLVRNTFAPRAGGGVMVMKKGGAGSARGGGGKKMNFKNDALTARAKRAGVLAEKARIEQKIKDIVKKEKMLSGKMNTLRGRR